MPGFFISNIHKSFVLNNAFNEKCIRGELEDDKYTIMRNTQNKFLGDKLFFRDEDCIIITEGVILNKRELNEKYGSSSIAQTLKKAAIELGDDYPLISRSAWCGAYYNAKEDTWMVFTNPFGDKAVFYYYENGWFMAASDMNYIVDALKSEQVAYSLNHAAVYDLLTYGWMGSGICDGTLIHEIKRIPAGCSITFNGNKVSFKRYHRFTNTNCLDDRISETEIIDMLDEKFKTAIRREYDKDLEYGFKHLTSLSGGYDSRMNTWVANIMGYEDMVNMTFSQAGYEEETIAQSIAAYLGTEWLYKSLNDAKFLFDLEDCIQMSNGLLIYPGISHGMSMIKLINTDSFGLLHSGQLGDVVISSFLYKPIHHKPSHVQKATSMTLISKVDASHVREYENEELYMMYVRGFTGAMASQIATDNYLEVVSPFIDMDFFEFCMSIPLKYRCNHDLYRKWIMRKYPEAGEFKKEGYPGGISDGKFMVLIKRVKKAGVRGILRKLLSHVGIRIQLKIDGDGMNPYDYWYQNNKKVKDFIDTYYQDHIGNPYLEDSVRKDMTYLYNNSDTMGKLQVLSVLAGIKIYFES